MATIHFVGGEIGGAGKSTFCMLLIEAFMFHKLPYHFRDTDRTTPNVGWAYDPKNYPKNPPPKPKGSIAHKGKKEWEPIVFSQDLDEYSQADFLLNLAKERDVIVNLPAQVSTSFDTWIEDGNYLSKQEKMNTNFVYWWVAKAEPRSLDLLLANAKRFPKMPFVLVCNQIRGIGETWNSILTEDLEKSFSDLGIKTIDMPELKLAPTERGLFDRESPKFQDVIEENDKRLSIASKYRCETFMEKTIENILTTGLLPVPTAGSAVESKS